MAKVVLITGSSSGVGRITAEFFARRDWNVAATARRPETIRTSDHISAFQLDVTDETSISVAVQRVVRRFGTIDVLVNNAAYGLLGPLEGVTTDQLEAQFRTNVIGAAAVIRHVLPIMRTKQEGTIINVSSLAGRMAEPFMSAYDATKFALEGMSESLWYELSLHGIRVKLVEPGQFKTGFLERSMQGRPHPAYDRAFENFMGSVRKEDAKAPEPQPVAEAIFRAANDRSPRLRYPVGGTWIRALHALLPRRVWISLVRRAMTRPPQPQ